ncbi:hypothetical protein G7B40_005910 [Aetokthonos hydrillicola Thurmond2011]|uniref:Periplasmic heavy metal sensor n=1 Tax=Aetokthonos hydrillicola Thurmond2011 TaxID=2712845 RepID=A0AAP5I3M1_9CYAN|nr:hypothetical protein [Aetokthonos hydrillicola]MBO3462834.1 hypothetical protein [Aetokthonos hydrillicola CCALA 1050]MBW4585132.1 hypothetical protein [Aetokthonos hydrillicola CCALA 1050]MDR9894106.1 hypothetical protein [Aetokthonos hydrillicola Thurmond2011]
MGINSAKFLCVFSTTITLAALLPGTATGQLSLPGSNPEPDSAPSPPPAPASTKPTTIQLNKLPVEQRAVIQSLMRERTQQIISVLDENQKSKFYEGLRKRRKLSKALEDVTLSPEQQSRISAIISQYNDKINAVATGQPTQPTQSTQQIIPSP